MINNSQTRAGAQLVCPYRENAFCASLPDGLRRAMCACCQVSYCPNGSVLGDSDWENAFTVLLSGFIVAADADADDGDAFSPMELMGGGSLLTLPAAWLSSPPPRMIFYVIKPCAVARFDRAGAEALRRERPEFAWATASALQRKYQETGRALRGIGGKDARRAVKYLLDFAQRHGIGYLTHAQIALATGLARPTVTKALHELLADEKDARE